MQVFSPGDKCRSLPPSLSAHSQLQAGAESQIDTALISVPWCAGGKLLGKIVVAPNLPDSQTGARLQLAASHACSRPDILCAAVYAVAFAGNKLVITHNTNLLQIDLNTTGVISTASF